MNKFCCLTFFAVLCSCAAMAQPVIDTAANADSVQREAASLFTHFSCSVKNKNNVELQWKIYNSDEGDYFIIQRSTDGDHYETVSAMRITDTATGYAITDNSVTDGTDFYRIKYISKSGKYAYSKIIQVNLTNVDFKFYPNPVDKLLIIRTSHNIDIQILDAVGAIKLTKQLQPGIQVINTSSLERGSYVLKVTDQDSHRVVSEQLLKN